MKRTLGCVDNDEKVVDKVPMVTRVTETMSSRVAAAVEIQKGPHIIRF